MKSGPDERFVNVQGRLLKFSHLSKVFYPNGFRKRDILRYYTRIGPVVLPYLRDRPFTLRRFPNGVNAPAFYEKQCPHYRQQWVATGVFGSTRYCLINDLPTLLWAVNLAAIELHTTLAAIQDMSHPTMAVLDLDPGEGADLHACVEVALIARDLLSELGLESFPKTSGMKGLHLMIPWGAGGQLPVSFAASRKFTEQFARALELRFPDLVTAKMPKKHRGGKVYVDWHQNVDFKTTTTVYSLRANDRPTVSAPLSWDEVLRMRKTPSDPLFNGIEAEEVLARVERSGDIFASMLESMQEIPGGEQFNAALGRWRRGQSRRAA